MRRERLVRRRKKKRRIEQRKRSEEDIGRKLGVRGERTRHYTSEERRTEERTRKMKKLVNST